MVIERIIRCGGPKGNEIGVRADGAEIMLRFAMPGNLQAHLVRIGIDREVAAELRDALDAALKEAG